jgi:medium-chain acyl-[acyl-carrier-protein] hydrolase
MATPRRPEKASCIRHRPDQRNEIGEAAVKLICFHHGGGGASSFNGWHRLLPSAIEMVRVQLPGREDRLKEKLVSSIDDLLEQLIPQLGPLLDRPAAFYGHSLGAIVAFEAIRHLRRNGHSLPSILFVSARRAPHLPLSHPAFCLASEAELVDYLASMGGMPDALLKKPHWRNQLLPIIREDLKISDLYVYREQPPLPCPITFFAGAADPWVKPFEQQGWKGHTDSEFRTFKLAGGHFFSRDEQATIVAEIVKSLGRYADFDCSLAPGSVPRTEAFAAQPGAV